MSPRQSARSGWLARPQADRPAWDNFRKAAAGLLGRIDADLQQHRQVGYTDIDALIHLSNAQDHTLRLRGRSPAVPAR